MAHPVSIHPLVIVLDSRIPGQPLTLTISQLFSPYSFLIIHLSIDSIELFSDVFQFLQDIFHKNKSLIKTNTTMVKNMFPFLRFLARIVFWSYTLIVKEGIKQRLTMERTNTSLKS